MPIKFAEKIADNPAYSRFEVSIYPQTKALKSNVTFLTKNVSYVIF
ncbi:MAG: hypothetical protein LLF92_00885 [Planctomycetaceae bacterium]|nr:hypothetical protein [Planctomycetaceae bacterium]